MTSRDRQNINELYHLHRYSKAALSRLYGLSKVRIGQILSPAIEDQTSFKDDDDCLLCNNDEAKEYFIDGNEVNKNPQNRIVLCEMDMRRIQHLQVRKGMKVIGDATTDQS